MVPGRGHRPGRGRDALFCAEITGVPAEHLDGGASASTMRTGADAIAVRLSNGQCRTLDGQTHEADPVTVSAALIAHFAA